MPIFIDINIILFKIISDIFFQLNSIPACYFCLQLIKLILLLNIIIIYIYIYIFIYLYIFIYICFVSKQVLFKVKNKLLLIWVYLG